MPPPSVDRRHGPPSRQERRALLLSPGSGSGSGGGGGSSPGGRGGRETGDRVFLPAAAAADDDEEAEEEATDACRPGRTGPSQRGEEEGEGGRPRLPVRRRQRRGARLRRLASLAVGACAAAALAGVLVRARNGISASSPPPPPPPGLLLRTAASAPSVGSGTAAAGRPGGGGGDFTQGAAARSAPPSPPSSSPSPSFWAVPESFRLHGDFPRWGEALPCPRVGDGQGGGGRGGGGGGECVGGGGGGFDFASVLGFLDDLLNGTGFVGNRNPDAFVYVWGAGGGGGGGRGGARGIWVSEAMRRRGLSRIGEQLLHRVVATERALLDAQALLLRLLAPALRGGDGDAAAAAAGDRWPRLARAAASGGGGAGFPLIFRQGDYRGCSRGNYGRAEGGDRRLRSVPVLTVCATVGCNHSFPVPNFATLRDSLPSPSDWDRAFAEQDALWPWEKKDRRLVWRGTLTGVAAGPNGTAPDPPRVRLGIWAGAEERSGSPLLDIGVRRVPAGKGFSPEALARIPRKPSIPFENFTGYVAVLDVDGNSWSSRFGKLLCSGSVVVKVEPEYVDYFYNYLTPWEHYVPVRADLSDLMDKAEWALDVANEGRVREIVRAANRWCRERMTRPRVLEDTLDVLDAYAERLDRGDGGVDGDGGSGANWTQAWAAAWDRMRDAGGGPPSGWDMRRLDEYVGG